MLELHPTIKLLLALISMAAVSLGGYTAFIAVGLVIACLYLGLGLKQGFASLVTGLKMLARMRWFFLSILLIYGWLGIPVSVTSNLYWFSALLPSMDGLLLGLYRIAVMAVFALTINLLLTTSSKETLVEGMYCLLYPLSLIGLPIERLVIRIVMVLGIFEEASLSLKRLRNTARSGTWLDRASQTARAAYDMTLQKAKQQPCEMIEFNVRRPASIEWCLPIGLCALFLLLPNGL